MNCHFPPSWMNLFCRNEQSSVIKVNLNFFGKILNWTELSSVSRLELSKFVEELNITSTFYTALVSVNHSIWLVESFGVWWLFIGRIIWSGVWSLMSYLGCLTHPFASSASPMTIFPHIVDKVYFGSEFIMRLDPHPSLHIRQMDYLIFI